MEGGYWVVLDKYLCVEERRRGVYLEKGVAKLVVNEISTRTNKDSLVSSVLLKIIVQVSRKTFAYPRRAHVTNALETDAASIEPHEGSP